MKVVGAVPQSSVRRAWSKGRRPSRSLSAWWMIRYRGVHGPDDRVGFGVRIGWVGQPIRFESAARGLAEAGQMVRIRANLLVALILGPCSVLYRHDLTGNGADFRNGVC